MRHSIIIPVMVLILSCGDKPVREEPKEDRTPSVIATGGDTVLDDVEKSPDTITPPASPAEPEASKVYSNKRFRNVTVTKLETNKYRVRGEGQIFEAAFSWVIEDGHNELKEGHEMTDAGAPEWGRFNFVVKAPDRVANRTLHIILYESSPNDGSRQYELPIPLP